MTFCFLEFYKIGVFPMVKMYMPVTCIHQCHFCSLRPSNLVVIYAPPLDTIARGVDVDVVVLQDQLCSIVLVANA